MTFRFSQKVKSLLISLAVTPAYHSFARGLSMKKKKSNQKGDESQASCMEEELHLAFHGDSENHKLSFADMLCSVTGIFQKLISSGYVTLTDVQVVDGGDNVVPSFDATNTNQRTHNQPLQVIKLNLQKLLKVDDFLVLNNHIRKQLHQSTMSGTKATLVSGRTLLNTLQKDMKGVKKLLALEKKFLNSDGQLPSGTNEEDLIEYIWKESWKQHSFIKKKQNDQKQQKENNNEGPVEVSDHDLLTTHYDLDADQLYEIPEDYEVPELKSNGAWYPQGYPVYLLYVSKITRVYDDFVHLYVGDGKSLDEDKNVRSRKEEREFLAKKKKDEKKAMVGNGTSNIIKQQLDELIAVRQSRADDNRHTERLRTVDSQIRSVENDMKITMSFLQTFYDDREEMKMSDEWKEYLDLKEKKKRLNREFEEIKGEEVGIFSSKKRKVDVLQLDAGENEVTKKNKDKNEHEVVQIDDDDENKK